MNIKRMLIATFVIVTLLATLAIPAMAEKPNEPSAVPLTNIKEAHDTWPAPLTDINKAVPFSNPLANADNPESPYYNPEFKYGLPGTRLGPPDQGILGIRSTTDGWFGTHFNSYNQVDYVYAHHSFSTSVSVPANTVLYAPTLKSPGNNCSLEILSRYWRSGGTMQRTIAVYDHYLGSFQVDITGNDINDYLNGYGNYVAEIMYYSGTWYALIYNFSTSSWETLRSQQPAATGTDGWCYWEQHGFDSAQWPDLGVNFQAKDIIIKLPSDPSSHYATATYADENDDLSGAPYNHDWTSEYYHWWLDGDL
ncbi:MAG: hypothetical protein R6U89_10670 [Dehalococcoidia bacterium]